MRKQFTLSSYLPNDPGRVWSVVKMPALFLHVVAPLVTFSPVGLRRFPEQWEEREYRGKMKLLGLLPIGWQAIVISFPPSQNGRRTLIDSGFSPVLPIWSHTIEVVPERDGTRYEDRVSFDAGWLTFALYPGIRLFFAYRQARLRTLAKTDFEAILAKEP